MKFSPYWAKAEVSDRDRHGDPIVFACWRSSDVSHQDARLRAQAAARRQVDQLIAGEARDRYHYTERPMREEVKQQFKADDGRTFAVITENSYGSLVLNTTRVMFVDIDLPHVTIVHLHPFFKGLPDRTTTPSPEVIEDTLYDAIRRFVSGNQPWSGRLYRTHSGFRLLATHALFEPAGDATQAVFDALAADPLYVRMCRVQECFRARLTPKPWRCGLRERCPRWPRESDEQQQHYQRWKADYLSGQACFATCRLVESIGEAPVHPEAQQIIDIHDEVTRVGESLGLA